MKIKKSALIAASVAGLIAAANLGFSAPAQAATGELENCYGVNACKGAGACGGKGHSCAGANACKSTGYVQVAKGACEKIQGGRLTEEAVQA